MYEAEHDFIDLAKSRFAELVETVTAGQHVNFQHFEDIALSAKGVQARAVMVCARKCAALYSTTEDTASQQYELRTLSRLIGQFEDGLLEISPRSSALNLAQSMAGNLAQTEALQPLKDEPVAPVRDAAASAAEIPDIAEEGDEARLPKQAEAGIAKQAAAQLSELIVFAPREDQSALARLIEVSGFQAPDIHNVEAKEDYSDKTDIEAIEVSPLELQEEKHVSLESVLAPISSEALSTAHRQFKQVSLSYACDDVSVSQSHAPIIQTLLSLICDQLINKSVRLPSEREEAELSGTSQIAVTASQTQAGLSIDVFCDDQSLAQTALDTPAISKAYLDFGLVGGAMRLSQARGRGTLICLSQDISSRLGRHQMLQSRPARLTDTHPKKDFTEVHA